MAARRAGRLILVDAEPKPVLLGMVAVYCRVPSADQKDDLERQVGRVVAGATGRGLAVGRVRHERTSRQLTRLSDPAVTVTVMEYRDRLTRFGFEHLSASMAAGGRRIVVLEESEITSDLVCDVTEVLTGLCARLHGQRSASRRAAKAVAIAIGEQS